jgi:malate dehydrogenase (oxaloacetate-decarboxylating)
VTGKEFDDLNIVVSGAGAAGYAIVRLLECIGYSPDVCQRVHDIIVCDTQGIIHRNRKGLYANKYKFILADETNHAGRTGGLAEALEGADVFIGVSAPGIVNGEMIRTMNDDPIVFAIANPVPEVMPEIAKAAGAGIVGTGRSDYPNQINNALAFPGVFRGALDARAKKINDEMKVTAAHAIANHVEKPTRDHILPPVLDKSVVKVVASAVREAAENSGTAREIR